MDLSESGADIQSKEEFVGFLVSLSMSVRLEPAKWESVDLAVFLESWSAWLSDSDGFYEQRGEKPIETPTWKSLAEMLLAARVYE